MTDNPSINKLRVVNINFQSIMNKKAALDEFIFTYKPHIIVGTETWLSPNVNNNEVIIMKLYLLSGTTTSIGRTDQTVMVEL